jgi:SAM-dependent methyltransferase
LRYDLVRAELDRAVGSDGHLGDVLEVGAGQGGVGTRLALRSRYTGVDLDPVSVGVARERLAASSSSGRILQGNLDEQLGADERFDWVCAFEVLEHIREDRDALTGWVGRLRPGGHLALSVPAFAARYSYADRLAGHYRRYDPPTLEALLSDVGLVDVRVRCYGMPLGYALEWGRNTVARRRGYAAAPAGDGAQDAGTDTDLEQSTLGSARFLQPGAALGPLIAAGTWPFRVTQRRISLRGTGLVAIGAVPV